MSHCAEPGLAELLLPFQEGALSPKERDAVQEHLHSCSRCQEELTLLRESKKLLASAESLERCPSPEDLLYYCVKSAGKGEERSSGMARIEKHLASCFPCQHLADLLSEVPSFEETPADSSLSLPVRVRSAVREGRQARERFRKEKPGLLSFLLPRPALAFVTSIICAFFFFAYGVRMITLPPESGSLQMNRPAVSLAGREDQKSQVGRLRMNESAPGPVKVKPSEKAAIHEGEETLTLKSEGVTLSRTPSHVPVRSAVPRPSGVVAETRSDRERGAKPERWSASQPAEAPGSGPGTASGEVASPGEVSGPARGSTGPKVATSPNTPPGPLKASARKIAILPESASPPESAGAPEKSRSPESGQIFAKADSREGAGLPEKTVSPKSVDRPAAPVGAIALKEATSMPQQEYAKKELRQEKAKGSPVMKDEDVAAGGPPGGRDVMAQADRVAKTDLPREGKASPADKEFEPGGGTIYLPAPKGPVVKVFKKVDEKMASSARIKVQGGESAGAGGPLQKPVTGIQGSPPALQREKGEVSQGPGIADQYQQKRRELAGQDRLQTREAVQLTHRPFPVIPFVLGAGFLILSLLSLYFMKQPR